MISWAGKIPSEERRAALGSLLIAVTLLVAKFVAYFLTGSAVVFSDALESIVNVAAAIFSLRALSLAHTPADREHPYGHGKIEFLSGGFEGGLILAAAVVIIVKAIDALLHGGIREHHVTVAILLMCGALLINGGAGLHLIRTGRRSHSMALEADGRHLLSDAVTSVLALIALLLVRQTGRMWIDPILALVAAAYISRVGLTLLGRAAGGLMDRQDHNDQLLLQRILDSHVGAAGAQPRICSYHKLRHRHTGRYHWVDFHIMVPADWDVRRGHAVASAIEYEIERALGEGNATAHVEPCRSEGCPICREIGPAAGPSPGGDYRPAEVATEPRAPAPSSSSPQSQSAPPIVR